MKHEIRFSEHVAKTPRREDSARRFCCGLRVLELNGVSKPQKILATFGVFGVLSGCSENGPLGAQGTDFKTIVLVFHVLVGALALGTGLFALVGPKTGRAHRRAGVAFFACMAGICATALWLALARRNWFLLQVDGLSWYFALTGWLALARKGLGEGDRAPYSHLVAPVALTLWSLGWGLFGLREMHGLTIAFALLGLAASVPDLVRLAQPAKRRDQWLVDHVIGFAGAFVASVTALVVVNARHIVDAGFRHRYLFWLVPPVVGFVWIAIHARRMRRRASREPATTVPARAAP